MGNINDSLMPNVLVRESKYGEQKKNFTGSDKGYMFNQSSDSPAQFDDSANITVFKSTTGSQVQDKKTSTEGALTLTGKLSNQISNNDFMVLASTVWQNDYEFLPTIANGIITAITNNTDAITNNIETVTITVTDIGTLVENDAIHITGRTVNNLENDRYIAYNVTANSFDIDYIGGFDTDLNGTITAELNTHKSKIENYDNCQQQLLDSSYSIYMPEKFEKADCAVGEGEIAVGCAVETFNIDFFNSNYDITMMGKEKIDDSDNLPSNDDQYIETLSDDQYYPTERPLVRLNNEVQEALALNLNVTLGLGTTSKTKKAGKMNRVVVEGAELKGTWSMLFLKEDDLDNYSKTLYDNRLNSDFGEVLEFGLESNSGSIWIKGYAQFAGTKKNKVPHGWELTTEFQLFKNNDVQKNIELTVVNGYSTSMGDLFRSLKTPIVL